MFLSFVHCVRIFLVGDGLLRLTPHSPHSPQRVDFSSSPSYIFRGLARNDSEGFATFGALLCTESRAGYDMYIAAG
jgi:hypothetical protein